MNQVGQRPAPLHPVPAPGWRYLGTLILPDRPVNLKNRRRTLADGRSVRTVAVRRYQETVWAEAVRQLRPRLPQPVAGQVAVRATVRCRSPLPDTDTLLSALWDALEGIVYQWDNQISQLQVIRRQVRPGESEQTWVTFWERL